MPKLSGIIETALYVEDVHRSAEFYRSTFDLATLLESDRLIALNVAHRSVLLLFKAGTTGDPFTTPGGVIPGHPGNGPTHFAFSIAKADVEPWRQHLTKHEIPIESTVTWPGGAESLYFRDPDQNLVELITPGFWANY